MSFQIKKFDHELQIVYGEIYAPNVPDAQGDMMTPEEVRKMAHRFMRNLRMASVDTMHDNKENGSYVVESFIAAKIDPVYLSEAWVAGIHVPDKELWTAIKSGKYNGFSLQAMVTSEEVVLELEIPDEIRGETMKAEGHHHSYFVKFDDEGNFIGGFTNAAEGHSHRITRATVTEPYEDGHTHRFSILEAVHLISRTGGNA